MHEVLINEWEVGRSEEQETWVHKIGVLILNLSTDPFSGSSSAPPFFSLIQKMEIICSKN